jgi:hypothetical protein
MTYHVEIDMVLFLFEMAVLKSCPKYRLCSRHSLNDKSNPQARMKMLNCPHDSLALVSQNGAVPHVLHEIYNHYSAS